MFVVWCPVVGLLVFVFWLLVVVVAVLMVGFVLVIGFGFDALAVCEL